MVEPREESLVFVQLAHEWIRFLLELQLDTNSDRTFWILGSAKFRAFVRSLHQARSATGDDVAAHLDQIAG